MTTGRYLLRLAATVSFWTYLLALLVLGTFGALAPAIELETLYGLDLGSWEAGERATLLHQYRFLKGFVLGFALFSFLFRREIFRRRVYNRIFLFTLFAAAVARMLSLVLDGRPHPSLIPLAAAEFLFGFSIFADSRDRLED